MNIISAPCCRPGRAYLSPACRWFVMLVVGLAGVSTPMRAYNIFLANNDTVAHIVLITEPTSSHKVFRLRLPPGAYLALPFEYAAPSDNKLNVVWNDSTGAANVTNLIDVVDDYIISLSITSDGVAQLTTSVRPPTVRPTSAFLHDSFATLLGSMLALGVTCGGTVFSVRFLWRFFQHLIGTATWKD